MKESIYALGWDVGGWMGKNNSFVFIKVDTEKMDLNWFIPKSNYQIKKGALFDLDKIIQDLYDQDISDDINLVIGIDAPLTFPEEFIKFLLNKNIYIKKPDKEIYNKLAYRETDRLLYQKYSKKPLSATFDRLGNNATVAISHIRYWQEKYNIYINPLKFENNMINIIETYPAMLKPGKYEKAFDKIDDLIPESIEHGTDCYDAALCALMAVQFSFDNKFDKLPSLVYPTENKEFYQKEGWIYHFDIER